jgi:hypothetical protein
MNTKDLSEAERKQIIERFNVTKRMATPELSNMTCVFCGSKDCYEIILDENCYTVMKYQRGAQFLCRECFNISIRFDNFTYRIMKVYFYLKRKMRL